MVRELPAARGHKSWQRLDVDHTTSITIVRLHIRVPGRGKGGGGGGI